MELKLSQEDVENILLQWAQIGWPDKFNSVEFDTNYSSLRGVTLSLEVPEPEAAPQDLKAVA